jgi:hypothetical protein
MDRLVPAEAEAERDTGVQSVRSSDQFAALLESLDAIAHVIQSAVSTKKQPVPASTMSVERQGPVDGEMPALVEASVAKETLGLFALEAREWIRQIQVALTACDQPEPRPGQPGLLRIMLEAMSNLARSAATVPLPAIERMALDLLPLLDAAGRQNRSMAAHYLHSLEDGLARLASAVRELPCEAEDVTPHEPTGGIVVTVTESRDAHTSEEMAAGGMESAAGILDALRRLHEVRGRSMQPMRDILDEVLRQADHMERDAILIDVATIGRILDNLDKLDERFLAHVTERVPVLAANLAQLERRPGISLSGETLASILHDIDDLDESAELVHATAITLFLQGLRAFLTVASQGERSGVARRLQAVRSRLTALVPLAKQWVDIGRLERTAIIDILPV